MEHMKEKTSGRIRLWRICPVRHILALLGAAVIAAHLLTRSSHDWNAAVSEHLVRPIHRALAQATAKLPFSLAELLIVAAGSALAVYIIISAVRLIRHKNRKRQVYIIFVTILCVILLIYAGFCLLWGVFYYGDDFAACSGLVTRKVSVGELETVTAYFADLANQYADQVPRDGEGVCATDRKEVLEKSVHLYDALCGEFPCLQGPAVPAKAFALSRLLSYVDFTGFFFPFTAEANVNTDFPPSLFAATVAHELAHQRGVAKEQEANFVAVLASLADGDPDYCYSAALLAYTHLGNALASADREAWEKIYSTLDGAILRDFAANRVYWAQFETPVRSVSDTVYESFLQSYDQKLGLKSYGACVDLLVMWYYDAALAAMSGNA